MNTETTCSTLRKWDGDQLRTQDVEDAQFERSSSPNRPSPEHSQLVRYQCSNQAAGSHNCTICGRGFPIRKTLYRHQRTVHQGQANLGLVSGHECSICHRLFNRKDILDRHEKHQHGAQKVECMICGKEIAQRYLLEHFRTRSCQTAQLNADTSELIYMKAHVMHFSLDITERFSLDSVAEPLLVAVQLYDFWFIKIKPFSDSRLSLAPPRELHVRHLELVGLMTRTIFRFLSSTCPTSIRIQVAIAIGMTGGSFHSVNPLLGCTCSRVLENLWDLKWVDLDAPKYEIAIEGSTSVSAGIHVFRGSDGSICDCKVGVMDPRSCTYRKGAG